MIGGIVTSWISYNGGGVSVAVRGLVRALKHKCGVDLRLFSLEDQALDLADQAELDMLQRFRVSGPKALGYAPALLPGIRAANPDFLHVHGLWMYPSWAALRFTEDMCRPNVVSPHGMLDPWALQRSRWKKRIASALYEDRHMRQSRCLHALCESELNSIRACGFNNPVCIIPNGVTLPANRVYESPWNDIPSGKKVCLYLGRIHQKKGVDLLVQAWDQMPARQRADWHLAIAGWGTGSFHDSLCNAVKSVDDVSFVGPLFGDAKDAAYQHSNAFILPSFSEGLPMTILEAWSHRLPVIMTPACNLPIGFESGASLAIDPSIAGIRRGLASVMASSDDERAAMGKHGRQLVNQFYTWDQVAERFLDVYRWLVDGASQPNCVAA